MKLHFDPPPPRHPFFQISIIVSFAQMKIFLLMTSSCTKHETSWGQQLKFKIHIIYYSVTLHYCGKITLVQTEHFIWFDVKRYLSFHILLVQSRVRPISRIVLIENCMLMINVHFSKYEKKIKNLQNHQDNTI